MRAYALYVAYVLHPTQLHVQLSLFPTTLVERVPVVASYFLLFSLPLAVVRRSDTNSNSTRARALIKKEENGYSLTLAL